MNLCTLFFIFTLTLTAQCTAVSHAQGWDPKELDPEHYGPPSFIDTPDRVEVGQGGMAELPCSVNNLGTKKVIWRRKSDPNPLTIGKSTFVNDSRISVQFVPFQPEWPLIIKQVQLDDEGQYECQVSSKDRQLRKYVYLKVLRGPIVDHRPSANSHAGIVLSGNTYVEKGHTLRLMCNATSENKDLPDELDWFFSGQKVTSDPRKKVSIHKQIFLMDRTIHSALEIQSVDMSNAGVYVCRTSDLQVVSARVDVLNADTKNSKRETEKSTGPGQSGTPRPQTDRLDNSGSRNLAGPFSSPPAMAGIALLACLVTLLTMLLTTRTNSVVVNLVS